MTEGGGNVVRDRRDGHGLDASVVARGEFADIGAEEVDGGSFPAGGRVQVNKRACEGENVHGIPFSWRARKKEGTAKNQRGCCPR